MTLAFDETAHALRVRIDAHERYATLKLEDVLSRRLDGLTLERVLDGGCGSGNFSPLLAARSSVVYVGMDKSAALLKDASLRCRRERLSRATFVQADMDQPLPFESRRFELAFFAYSAYYTDRADRLLGEIARVLTASGQLVLIGPALGNASELDLLSEQIFGVPASPAKSVRVRRLEDEFLPVLRRRWRDPTHDLFDCSLVFPDVASYTRYYKATPQFIELAAEHGVPDDGRIAARIERLPAPCVTKKVVLLQATRPPL
jgi:ubiquinone/menaquinone biosynthesis C-methylase UbiE